MTLAELASVLTDSERVSLSLRKLYSEQGYTQYRMSKFEEYDLYARNKDFLISDNIITFTDTDGRLLALKPDVTLSIVKNSRVSEGTEKLFYNENVYRVSSGTGTFRELMQLGLECIGEVGEDEVREVLSLALSSLSEISSDYSLGVSSLDVVASVMLHFGLSEESRDEMLALLGKKNVEGIRLLGMERGLPDEAINAISLIASLHGSPEAVLGRLDALRLDEDCSLAIDRLSRAVMGLGKGVSVDFSVVGDMSYYNGIAFRGFIDGVPSSVLSGGQYDGLMQKMGKRARAVGFAVYLDGISKQVRG